MKTTMTGMCMVLLACAAQAADRAWDGGGGDANWSTVANWDGDATAPAADDALFFGGTAKAVNTNDLDGLSIAGLTFNSGAVGFTLNGNALTLGGTIVNNDNDTQTVNLPMALDAARSVYTTGGPVTLGGTLSGAGGLVKESANTLTLTASNSYEGATLVSTGVVRITHGYALGATNGSTTVSTLGRARLELSGGITVAEPLIFSGGNNAVRCLQNVSGSNVITGPMTLSSGRFGADSGTLVIAGGVSGNPFFVINGGATLIFNTTPLALGTLYADDVGLTILDVGGNTWGGTVVAKGTLRMGLENALPTNSYLRMGLSYGPAGTLDLNGYNQTVNHLYNDSTLAATRRVISATPARLTVNQSVNSIFDGGFEGRAGLCKAGSGTLTLTNNTPWTTTGDLIVSNGTLKVGADRNLGACTNIIVGGGTLELLNGTALSDLARVAISDGGAKLKVGASLTEAVGWLVLGETPALKGTYGMTGSGADVEDDAFFSGAGLLEVLYDPPIIPTNHVWDAEGADTLLSTAANWEDDATPPFGGTTHAIFATGGATATVDTAANLYGITFNRDGNFTLAAGDGALTVGLAGIAAATPSDVSRTYTLAEDLSLTAAQTWTLTRNGAGVPTLAVSGAISDGEQSFGITQNGNGILALSGANSYDGLTTVKTNGVLRISSATALGSTNGAAVIENGGYMEVTGGVVVEEPLTINGDAAVGYAGVLRSNGGSNVWSGRITSTGSRVRCNSGSLDVVGGVTGAQLVLGANGGAVIRFSEKPISASSVTAHSAGGGILLAVTNNTFTYLEVGGSYLRTELPGVFPPAVTLQQGSGSARSSLIDLNGNDQTVGLLRTGWSGSETRLLFSAAPATLTVNQSGNSEYNGSLTGAVTLVKAGTGSLTISGTNTTYGSFIVNAGTLTVNAVGTLGVNNTNVMINAGLLTLSNSVAVADAAVVRIADGGGAKINLAEGVNEAVGNLYLGVKQKRVGTYGSTSSGASVKDDTHFEGAGILTVLHDKSGTLFKIQ
jgi:autotransporter-associated beta strand protein